MKLSRPGIVLILLVALYIAYFSFVSTMRLRVLTASYFDMGIMHQTVYESYTALRTGDLSQFLELTDPHGSGEQIKRFAIHADPLLGIVSLAYFISARPETLLILQTIVLALGAVAIYKIAKGRWWGVFFAAAYLLYPPLQRANLYEFHAVVLATSMTLWMYYLDTKGWRVLPWILTILILMSKEQAGLMLGLYGLTYVVRDREGKFNLKSIFDRASWTRSRISWLIRSIFCFAWSFAMVLVVIPSFRAAGTHFAESYYQLSNVTQIVEPTTLEYLVKILGPLGFVPLFSPLILIPAGSDLILNIFSSSDLMRATFFQYTALITPWLFIAALAAYMKFNPKHRRYALVAVAVGTIFFAWFDGPLPFARYGERYVFTANTPEYEDVAFWAATLSPTRYRISTTGQLAPHFTSRRYFYDFSRHYDKADYVILRLKEIYNYGDKEKLIPVYESLQKDERYQKIYAHNGIEVYKKK